MLTIIIVNYKTSRELQICLESIVAYEPNYRQYEIIVVDNNSGDAGLEQVKSKFSFVNIIYAPRNGGFSYANNIGIRQASGDYILLLNPDTYLKDNSIEKLYDRMRKDPEIIIAGPKLLYPDGRNQSYYKPKSHLTLWRLFCMELFLDKIFKKARFFNSYFQTYMNYERERYVEQVTGTAFMLNKELTGEIGYLDENYFMYFEESDFCFQAVKKGNGRLLYYPASKIYHMEGGSTPAAGLEQTNEYYIESQIYFFRKNFGHAAARVNILFLFIGSVLRVIILGASFKKKCFLYYYYIKNLIKYLLKNKRSFA